MPCPELSLKEGCGEGTKPGGRGSRDGPGTGKNRAPGREPKIFLRGVRDMACFPTALKMVKSIPVLEEEHPAERFKEFYRKLGWDGTKVVDPTRVKMHRDDFVRLVQAEMERAYHYWPQVPRSQIALEIGFLWMNFGPSSDGETPRMVELLPGWQQKGDEH